MALDATSIGQNFVVLSINVLYRGSAIPVAWKVVKGAEKGRTETVLARTVSISRKCCADKLEGSC